MFEPKGWFADVTRFAVDRWAVAAGDDGFWWMDAVLGRCGLLLLIYNTIEPCGQN